MVNSKSQKKRIARLERDIDRLRSSPSLRLGQHVTKAMRKPWRAPFLLFTLPWMMLNIGLELLGKKPLNEGDGNNTKVIQYEPNNTVVMFPTNGVGFGHFTRMLAVAKRMKKLDPDLEIVFFTTMPTLHLLKPYGIVAHHISGPKYFKNMDTSSWNALLEEELTLCFETHKPKQFIFDGAFPYRGMLRAIKSQQMDKIWLRRGMFRKGATNIPIDSIEHFDAIVRPGDSAPIDTTDEQELSVEIIQCNPILLADREDLYPKSYLREKLGIPSDSTLVYVQLGAGEINDIESDLQLTIRLLLERENTYIVVGESMIGNRLDISGERIRTLRDYPNSLYFNSFDFAVMAGGYNSYHEAIAFQLPTICIPNKKTGMDDQVARAIIAGDAGAMIVVKDANEKSMRDAIENIWSKKKRKDMKTFSSSICKKNGAPYLADLLLTGKPNSDAVQIHASMASVPWREDTLQEVVNSILPQVDRLNIYLNSWENIPNYLKSDKINVIKSQDAIGDIGDRGKFYWCEEIDGLHLTIDDDIIYPNDYVTSALKALNQNGKSIITYHGSKLISEKFSEKLTVSHFSKKSEIDQVVDIGGTGVMAYMTSDIKVHFDSFKCDFWADGWMAIQAKEQDVPLIALSHEEGWLKPVDTVGPEIWAVNKDENRSSMIDSWIVEHNLHVKELHH